MELVTPTSLALSLSAPLAPSSVLSKGMHKIVKYGGGKSSSRYSVKIPASRHPHLPKSQTLEHRVFKTLRHTLPLSWQHSLRDSGGFRKVVDNLTFSLFPMVAVSNPWAAIDFFSLEKSCKRLDYGSHKMQEIHLYENSDYLGATYFQKFSDSNQMQPRSDRGLVFFIVCSFWPSC